VRGPEEGLDPAVGDVGVGVELEPENEARAASIDVADVAYDCWRGGPGGGLICSLPYEYLSGAAS
jgi:hypothetical protein